MLAKTRQSFCHLASNFQEKVESCFMELCKIYSVYLDDFFQIVISKKVLIKILRQFLKICCERFSVVSLRKSGFYLKQVHWCGGTIDGNGICYNLKNVSELIDSKHSNNMRDVCKYVHSVSWLSPSISRFAERTALFIQLLEKRLLKLGETKEKVGAKISLASLGWNNDHFNTFQDLQNRLKESTKLNYRDMVKTLCVHTDA